MNNNQFTILIVDDIPQNIKVLGSTLKDAGYNVDFALDGKSALEWVDSKAFDLILLDIMMPEMDGFEVCTRIKNNPKTTDVPIVFITAKNSTDDIIKGFDYGAIDYITKPFNAKELLVRIKTHLDLQLSKKQLVALNKDLDKKNTLLMQSVQYASRIQEAVLPFKENTLSIIPEHFVYYQPRDIVSGDFYWIKQINDKGIIVAGDCTGHGIPGAFMSMLGISFLNEIASEIENIEPSFIVNELNKKLVKTLQQNRENAIRDSMEIAVCVLDYSNRSLEISSSGLYAFIIREKGITKCDKNKIYTKEGSNKDIVLFKGDSFQTKVKTNKKPISKCKIDLNPDDLVILTSDGYLDQLGGDKATKFKRSQFIELLFKICDMPLKEQEKIFTETMKEWMKPNYKQVDDMLIFGFKVKQSYGEVDLF